jgi:alpha-L-fucosidase-like protein
MTRTVVVLAVLLSAGGAQAEKRAAWMKEARFGVMTHYLEEWIAKRENLPGGQMSVEQWNGLVDHFDVDALASQVASVGARYYLVTIGQGSGFYLAPNATYDRLVGGKPGRLARRDLVSALYQPLARRGIKLMVYLGTPRDPAVTSTLQLQRGPYRNREYQLKWEQVIRDWSLRWGKKVAGWWFDGCYWPNAMYRSAEPPNFASFAAAARAGNPDAALAFNPGVVDRLLSITPYEDYTAGEIDHPDRILIRRVVDGKVDGAVPHALSFLGQTWGTGPPRFTTAQVVEASRAIAGLGGVITWDTPIERDGKIAAAFLEQLAAVGKAVRETPVPAAAK